MDNNIHVNDTISMEEELYCTFCNGTGIAYSGPIDRNCDVCKGTGLINDKNEEEDFDIDD